MFPLVSEAIATVMPVERLRWIMFGHFEADECGAMNQFLAAAPDAQVAHGALGCMVSLDDQADRPPRRSDPTRCSTWVGERVRNLDTPHVPHGWDSHSSPRGDDGHAVLWRPREPGRQGPAITGDDLLEAAAMAEDMFHSTCLNRQMSPTIRAARRPRAADLAIMHGSSYTGDGAAVLQELADDYERAFPGLCRTG